MGRAVGVVVGVFTISCVLLVGFVQRRVGGVVGCGERPVQLCLSEGGVALYRAPPSRGETPV